MSRHMQPNDPPVTGVLNEVDAETNDGGLNKSIVGLEYANERSYSLIWHRVFMAITSAGGAIIGVYFMFTSAKTSTIIFTFLLSYLSGFGITAGAHRLWAHRAYKAKLPLRILLVVFQTSAYGLSVIDWARDHRVHHKYTETDADPYNATRGFFFSHFGWMLCKKHPENLAKTNEIDVSDLENDPVLRFQDKYYNILMPIAFFILPTWIPVYFWNESIFTAMCVAVTFRRELVINIASCVNSFAHMYGSHRYDKSLNAADNRLVAFLALGEGWHNYHHTFPWDYKTGELGLYSKNFTTFFIDFMAKIGWAYDLKTVSPEMIKRRVERTGDGTHSKFGRGNKTNGLDQREKSARTFDQMEPHWKHIN